MNVILELIDDQYPFIEVRRVRHAARGVVMDENGRVGLTHLFVVDDPFGGRNYYELPGGGVKRGETPLEAAIREMEEELGVGVELLKELGVVHDFYNLIFQENYTHYFLFKVTSYGQNHLEPRESALIDRIEWIDLDTAIQIYQNYSLPGVGLLVKRRELPVLKLAKDYLHNRD